jgi:CheY-like chemotaxis protein
MVPIAIAFVEDLMFVSRIRAAAGATDVRVVRGGEALLEACRAAPGALVVVDLDDPRLEALGAVERLRADPGLSSVPIVGFVSHLNAGAVASARRKGVTRILARSAFVAQLPRILAEGAAGTITAGGTPDE